MHSAFDLTTIKASVEYYHASRGEWLTGLFCLLMDYFSRRTVEILRQIGDSSLNHENTPTGDRGSTNMDTVWEGRIRVKNQRKHC